MTLDDNLNKTELVKIIRSLVAFIVIDSKDFVKDELKEAFIEQYLYTLSKSMNGKYDVVNVSTLWKIVEKDISFLMKNQKLK